MFAAVAGWYPNPDKPGTNRWWNGASWTDHTLTDFSEVDLARLSKADARAQIVQLQQTVHRLEQTINEQGLREFVDFIEWRQQQISILEQHRAALYADNDRVSAERDAARAEYEVLRSEVVVMKNSREFQEVGLFDFDHPAEESTTLAAELATVRAQIKDAIRNKQATSASRGFTFNNSAAQGRRFVNSLSKILLRAYNAEAENAIKTTRAGNLSTAQARLSRAAEQIAKNGSMIDLKITQYFHQLRLQEIELAHRHLKALQREKELERERREELREQRKAEIELKKEQERLEKERAHYLSTIATLESNGDEEGAARVRERLVDVERAIEDVDYRAANIRAGYVYVISNIGSFGPDVVKIGMTRRLDPMDRVRELGDASVPYRFDVHALFFADDAVAVESLLHKEFAAQRINQVNLRREYFRVTPHEVLEKLRAHHVEVLEFRTEPEAEEFYASQGIRAQLETIVR